MHHPLLAMFFFVASGMVLGPLLRFLVDCAFPSSGDRASPGQLVVFYDDDRISDKLARSAEGHAGGTWIPVELHGRSIRDAVLIERIPK